MENDIKVRLRNKTKKDELASPWRYALTISNDGCIISSTTDAKRAATFSVDTVNRVSVNRGKFHSKMEVESF